jgi:hypothetical protein
MEIYGQAINRYYVWCNASSEQGLSLAYAVLHGCPLISDVDFQQICSCWRMTSINIVDVLVQAWPASRTTWTATRVSETEFCFRPETLALLMKLLIAVKMPEAAERGDIVELVPPAEECRWLRDR